MQVNLPKTGYKTYCKVHLVSQYLTGGNETARIRVDDVDDDKELARSLHKVRQSNAHFSSFSLVFIVRDCGIVSV